MPFPERDQNEEVAIGEEVAKEAGLVDGVLKEGGIIYMVGENKIVASSRSGMAKKSADQPLVQVNRDVCQAARMSPSRSHGRGLSKYG